MPGNLVYVSISIVDSMRACPTQPSPEAPLKHSLLSSLPEFRDGGVCTLPRVPAPPDVASLTAVILLIRQAQRPQVAHGLQRPYRGLRDQHGHPPPSYQDVWQARPRTQYSCASLLLPLALPRLSAPARCEVTDSALCCRARSRSSWTPGSLRLAQQGVTLTYSVDRTLRPRC